jgi:hypothetical protein
MPYGLPTGRPDTVLQAGGAFFLRTSREKRVQYAHGNDDDSDVNGRTNHSSTKQQPRQAEQGYREIGAPGPAVRLAVQ